MNWTTFQVSEEAYRQLVEFNQPIPVSVGTLPANAGVEIFTLTGKQMNAIYDANLQAIRLLNSDNPVFSSMANRDLLLYNDHLLNPSVNTIVVDGFFGTGKTSTFMSHLVYGLRQELDSEKDGAIPQAYISKPHEGVGKSHGHLPGDLYEKTDREFGSYYQYFDRFGMPGLAYLLMGRNIEEEGKFAKQKFKLLQQPLLHMLTFEYIRGLDIERGWVVLDESQNTNVKEMSSFLSRLGDKVKAVVIGDSNPTQIDKGGNTPTNNGLAFAQETYLDKRYAGHITMQTSKHILRGQRVRDLYHSLKKRGGA